MTGDDARCACDGSFPADAITTKIQEFFRLNEELLRWITTSEEKRVLGYLKPVSSDDLICELLPEIFRDSFPGVIRMHFQKKFIAAVLQHSRLRPENSKGSVAEMIEQRQKRRKRRNSKKTSLIAI